MRYANHSRALFMALACLACDPLGDTRLNAPPSATPVETQVAASTNPAPASTASHTDTVQTKPASAAPAAPSLTERSEAIGTAPVKLPGPVTLSEHSTTRPVEAIHEISTTVPSDAPHVLIVEHDTVHSPMKARAGGASHSKLLEHQINPF